MVAKVANRDLAHKGHCITRETRRTSWITSYSTDNGTATIRGRISVSVESAADGTVFPALGFSNGTFSLHGVDGSDGGANDKLALSILRPDGSTYHLSAGVPGLLSGGNLTIH